MGNNDKQTTSNNNAHLNPASMTLTDHNGDNQSCLTADMWYYLVCGNTIPARSKRSIHCDRVRHPEPSGAGWRKKVARWRERSMFILDI